MSLHAILASLRRLRAQVVKELLCVLRDPKSRVVLIVPPLVQLFIFSFAPFPSRKIPSIPRRRWPCAPPARWSSRRRTAQRRGRCFSALT